MVAALRIVLPVHAKQAHDFSAPSRAIEHARVDIVIVDKSRLFFAEDLVRNDPFLRNSPKVLDIANVKPADVEALCAHSRIATFDYPQAVALGIMPHERVSIFFDVARAKLRAEFEQRGCGNDPVIALKP